MSLLLHFKPSSSSCVLTVALLSLSVFVFSFLILFLFPVFSVFLLFLALLLSLLLAVFVPRDGLFSASVLAVRLVDFPSPVNEVFFEIIIFN